jgi:hypothetical protein
MLPRPRELGVFTRRQEVSVRGVKEVVKVTWHEGLRLLSKPRPAVPRAVLVEVGGKKIAGQVE